VGRADQLAHAVGQYRENEATLKQAADAAVGLGYLLVPRPGLPLPGRRKETIHPVGDNRVLAGQLGLPPDSGLVLATTNLAEATLGALMGGRERDPLNPAPDADYGWRTYGSYEGPDSLPWASEDVQDLNLGVGRIVLVEPRGFVDRGDRPGHYFRTRQDELVGEDYLLLRGQEITQLAADGLVAWRGASGPH
jgi:hypothetical protein